MSDQNLFAVVGVFDTSADLYHACETFRDEGYKNFDAHTPFPVHGLEKAMGLKPSKLPWIVLAMGITGCLLGFGFQVWSMGVDYPLIIGGKPFFAYEAYIPITFEITVLFSAFGCFFGMWGLNCLPKFFHPVMQHKGFQQATDNKFLLSIETKDPKFNLEKIKSLFEKLGAQDVMEVTP